MLTEQEMMDVQKADWFSETTYGYVDATGRTRR